MALTDPAYLNLIQFVPEQSVTSKIESVKRISTISNGEDVKNFYESLVGATKSTVSREPSSKSQHSNSVPVLRTKSSSGRSAYKKTNRAEKSRNSEDCAVSLTAAIGNGNLKNKPFDLNKTEIETAPACAESLRLPSGSTLALATKRIPFHQAPTHLERKHFKFLQAAQLGDVKKVNELIEQGIDLNYKDFYGWTALMCAAKEGHTQVVLCLLQHGADSTLVNNEGKASSEVAQTAGHSDVAQTISTCYLHSPKDRATFQRKDGLISFYCDVCKEHFSEDEKKAHFTSTVHLLSIGRQHRHPAYLLPETNRGFQMLLRRGWEVDKGLGPHGGGIKYPVKTVLKRDREGLGSDAHLKKKAKITHFNPCDKAAVEAHASNPRRIISAKKSAQYALRSRERKQKRVEKNFRLEFRDI